MTPILATEGNYQAFSLGGVEYGWLYFALACGVVSLLVALALMREVLAADQGTTVMKEIANAIQEGAVAFLRRQFKAILIIIVPLAILVGLTATKVVEPNGTIALSQLGSSVARAIAFLVGATFSGLTGFVGMSLAVRGNVRTAAAARAGSASLALRVAFRTGGITGLFVVGLGLIGAAGITLIFQNSVVEVLVGFGFGCSLLALFMRVGGGIFTKAADVGADLVGKVEAGIPEDDPRNAATIADNVGDNVGDCAGMAADLFESYEITIIAALILGYAAFQSVHLNPVKGIIYPLVVVAFGILAAILGVFAVRGRQSDATAMVAVNRAYRLAGAATVVAAFLVAYFYVGDLKVFWAVLVGVGLGQAASLITEHFTSTERSPVREISDSSRTGPATTVLSGLSVGLESTVWAILAIVVAIALAIAIGGVANIELTLYLVALIGIGLLSTTGMVVSEDSFGPVADNAAGVAEMAGEFGGDAERIMVNLDAVGNTTKAITKGVAIASAVIATIALFASFVETIGSQLNLHIVGAALFKAAQTQINVANPTIFVGLLIGGSVAFMFSGLAIRAVGRSAGTVVQEVRRQFRDHPGIMDGTEKPQYGRVIGICTAAAQRELTTPALLAILTPVIVGFGINYYALGAFLAAAIVTAQLMAVFLSNAGGAWDNAKKYIEDGHEGGKGSEAHKAAVIGDTVGDPFKDTAGPALNPLIKVMNLVSLLILPLVISLYHHTTARYAIAAAALIILLASIAYSKRSTGTMAEEPTSAEVAEGDESVLATAGDGGGMAQLADGRDQVLRQAIDRWVADLGHEDHELRDRLLKVKEGLGEPSSAS
ncbi:MAG TPA: sodium-translocating pyrophosphatase [Acidimicrobiales bacterium]|nr:sodium-translocating pyrophosphatase [Acidimicrobiales bacterium]